MAKEVKKVEEDPTTLEKINSTLKGILYTIAVGVIIYFFLNLEKIINVFTNLFI